jgi:hypothetical protein
MLTVPAGSRAILARVKRTLIALAAALALAGPAKAGGPSMLVGVSETAVKQQELVTAKAKLDLARLAGFDTVRVTSYWLPGLTAPTEEEARGLRSLAGAARLTGLRVILAVHHPGSRTTPLTDEARGQFARYVAAIARAFPTFREFVIGNEPNLNGFWMPQFNEDGSNAAAPAYLRLLVEAYDALKAVSPQIVVIGGAVSPRGSDNHLLPRHTHSPTKFIRDLGAAYRASGRTKPIMDQFAFHPWPDSDRQGPHDSAHPGTTSIGLADYNKLVALVGEAFDGTPQPGSTMPIILSEYGIQTPPSPAKAPLYTGREPATQSPVDTGTQARYYSEAIAMAFCQPNVRGLMLFHLEDERDLDRWQSGVFYVDGTPKPSVAAVATAARAVRRGIIARCEGLALQPKVRRFRAPSGRLRRTSRITFRLDCDIDCAYTARLERGPGRQVVVTRRGVARGRVLTVVRLAARAAPGMYRIALELVAPVNPGPPTAVTSRPFRVVRR